MNLSTIQYKLPLNSEKKNLSYWHFFFPEMICISILKTKAEVSCFIFNPRHSSWCIFLTLGLSQFPIQFENKLHFLKTWLRGTKCQWLYRKPMYLHEILWKRKKSPFQYSLGIRILPVEMGESNLKSLPWTGFELSLCFPIPNELNCLLHEQKGFSNLCVAARFFNLSEKPTYIMLD